MMRSAVLHTLLEMMKRCSIKDVSYHRLCRMLLFWVHVLPNDRPVQSRLRGDSWSHHSSALQ